MRSTLGWARAVVVSAIVVAVPVAEVWAQAPRGGRVRSAVNHVDASLIRAIAPAGDELFMATNGGILIYDLQQSSFEQYNNARGVPTNNLMCLTFDDSGNLYLGTADIGIVKATFAAGRVSVNLFNAEFNGLAGNTINGIVWWKGRVVYGTPQGAGIIISDFPGATFDEDDGLPSVVVNDLLADEDVVWFATDGGVATLDEFGIITPDPDSPEGAMLISRSTDQVWVGTVSGVMVRDIAGGPWTNVGPSNTITALHFDGQTMWAGANDGIYAFNGVDWDRTSVTSTYGDYAMNQNNAYVSAITSTNPGTVYFGAGNPIQRRGINLMGYDGSALDNLRPNAITANRIARIDIDVDGSVWVGSFNFGVGKLTPEGTWVNYNRSIPPGDSLSNLFVNFAFLADSQGSKWFAAPAQAGLDELDDKLDDDYSNDVWVHRGIGADGGDGLGSLWLQRAAEDPAGNRWFLSDFTDDTPPGWWGLQILNREGTEWLQINPASTGGEMAAGDVDYVVFGVDDLGRPVAYIAMGSYGVQSWAPGGFDWASLTDLSDDSWDTIGKLNDEFRIGEAVTCLALRSDGVLWIGTDQGLIRFTEPFFYREVEDYRGIGVGILAPNVQDLALDAEENLWVATQSGLNRIARDDINDIVAFSTQAAFQAVLSKLGYGTDVVSPLGAENCISLATSPDRNTLYIGMFEGGMSVFDITPQGETETDLDEVYLYPNPVTAAHSELKIDGITSDVTVHVYNMEGNLVSSATVEVSADPDDQVAWDLLTNDGFIAASGVYMVRIVTSTGQTVVKTISLVR